MLKAKHIYKSFSRNQSHQGKDKIEENKIEILKDLNLEVSVGQTIAILGQSGSGKSTFLSTMSGIDELDEGLIEFNGVELSNLTQDEMTKFRGKNIGIIFQQFHLLSHLTALENVSLPMEIQGSQAKEAKNKALELLSAVGLEDRVDHFPSQLSGGEKQRVAIARSLILDPPLLLADEPSGSLDEDTGQNIMDLIFSLASKRGRTLVLVTHNQELAKRCEKVYLLEHGQLRDVTEEQVMRV